MHQNIGSFDKVKSEIRNCWTTIRIESCKDGWQFRIKMPPPTLRRRTCNKDGEPFLLNRFTTFKPPMSANSSHIEGIANDGCTLCLGIL